MFFSLISFLYSFFQSFFLAGYITGKSSFPKPLTQKEEDEFLEKAKNGDQEARDTLIERNLRLVAHIVKKYSQNTTYETEDLISVGTIGLIKAIDSFDNKKKIRLATYAARCIHNEILMLIRASKHRASEISLENPIGTDSEGNTISLLNIIGTDDDDITDTIYLNSRQEKLYEAINICLTEREKEIIKYRYGLYGTEEKPQREIANMLNISRSYVSRIEKKATDKLRSYLKNY